VVVLAIHFSYGIHLPLVDAGLLFGYAGFSAVLINRSRVHLSAQTAVIYYLPYSYWRHWQQSAGSEVNTAAAAANDLYVSHTVCRAGHHRAITKRSVSPADGAKCILQSASTITTYAATIKFKQFH